MCEFLYQYLETLLQGASTPADKCRIPPGDGSLLSSTVSLAEFQQQTFTATRQQTRLDDKLVDVRNGGRISLTMAGVFGILGVAAPVPPPPPTYAPPKRLRASLCLLVPVLSLSISL